MLSVAEVSFISHAVPSGDGKDSVRNEARRLLTLVMTHVVSPNAVFDRLAAAFSHKNGRVREELMQCLQNTLTRSVLCFGVMQYYY